MTSSTDAAPIPLVDLQRQVAGHEAALQQLLADGVARGDFILGRAVADFERAWADYLGCAHAVGVGSGTDALTLALRGLGIGPGHTVLTQATTFVATALAIRLAGADLTLCDVDDDGAIDLASYDGPTPDAVLPVHLFGRPVDVAPLRARFPEARIVEDACQAHGAAIGGRRCGTLGDAGTFSFYPSKNLGAFGDGGAIVTDDADLAARLRELRNLGSPEKFVHRRLGVNSRLDTLQAVVLGYKLPLLDGWNAQRRALAERLRAALDGTPGLTLPAGDPPGGTHVYHLFVVRIDPASGHTRDDVLAALRAESIGAGIHYPTPVHRQEVFAGTALAVMTFPRAEAQCAQILSLPLFPGMTEGEADRVAAAVRRALNGAR